MGYRDMRLRENMKIVQQKKKEKVFSIDIWSFIDMERLNDALDTALESTGKIPTDIAYRCVAVSANGNLKLKAFYYPERIFLG